MPGHDKLSLDLIDSDIQRLALVTKQSIVIHKFSQRPIKCKSCSWAQRDAKKVEGSHGRFKSSTEASELLIDVFVSILSYYAGDRGIQRESTTQINVEL